MPSESSGLFVKQQVPLRVVLSGDDAPSILTGASQKGEKHAWLGYDRRADFRLFAAGLLLIGVDDGTRSAESRLVPAVLDSCGFFRDLAIGCL
jgi:hypothetical protein